MEHEGITDYATFSNGAFPSATTDDIIAAMKEAKEKDREYQQRQRDGAREMVCPRCHTAAVWEENTLRLCPHYFAAVKKLPVEASELPVDRGAARLCGLKIGAIMSPEFAEVAFRRKQTGERKFKWKE